MADVAGQVVVITGAARGIGAELARQLAQHGARIALVGLEPEALAAQAQACGPDARWWTADVTDERAMQDVALQVRDHFGAIDVLVANAGVASAGPVMMADAASYDRCIEVNLLGSIRSTRAMLPYLVESKGYYLQIGSMASFAPSAVVSAYSASKSGIEAFANAIKPELRHHGVGVGVAYLSWIDTDMVRGADAQPALKAARQAMPWPLNLTFPAQPAAAALAKGIGRRKSRVMYPFWVWAMYLNRPISLAVTIRLGGRFVRRAEQVAAQDPQTSFQGLVGAGGAADQANRNGTASLRETVPEPG